MPSSHWRRRGCRARVTSAQAGSEKEKRMANGTAVIYTKNPSPLTNQPPPLSSVLRPGHTYKKRKKKRKKKEGCVRKHVTRCMHVAACGASSDRVSLGR